jgi:hypothetical protein
MAAPAAVLACALFVGAPAVTAQCLGPDNLNGPCCTPTTPALPPFPPISLPGLGVCWTQCTPNTKNDIKVSWTPLVSATCSEFVTQLSIDDATTGLPLMSGTMILDYTRTWIETEPSGLSKQVWRFAAKADLAWVPAGIVPPCPTPSCIFPPPAFNTAFYYGYLDYATCAAAGPWDNALVLYHGCDRFMHMPGLSSKPGVFHPAQSYAIVAPHNSAQQFMPVNQLASGGPVIAEATRNVLPGPICMVEDPTTAGAMTPLGAGCVCTLSAVPKQQTLRQFLGQTTCITSAGVPAAWATLNVAFPTLPWMHMVTTSIGVWTNGNLYPGKESAWVDEGLFVTQDACTGDWIELKYGGTTRDGWPATLPSGMAAKNFTDVADNYTAPLAGPYPTPILGNIMPTEHLLYVNEP